MVQIYTFGEFDIKINDKSIMESKGYSYKILRLFKYFLTYHGQRVLPDKIIEDFMMDREFDNPRNVLRTQISRVRNMVDEDVMGMEPFYAIESQSGYYIMKFQEDCYIDFQDFENLINEGETLLKTNPPEGISLLKRAIDIYQGQYLMELEDEEWTMPLRNRYDRLFSKGILMYLQALSKRGMHEEIIEMAENAVNIRPYEEMIHILFIEALIQCNQKAYANNHYQYYTSKLYNDLGIKPSQQMKDLYKRLQSYEEVAATGIVNLSLLDESLEEDTRDGGILICDKSYFKFLYNLEKRNKDRNTKSIFVGLISIDSSGHMILTREDIKKGIDVLLEVVYSNLRRGDVASKWNDSQLTILIYNISEENVHIVDRRLKKRFTEAIDDKRITISTKFKPL